MSGASLLALFDDIAAVLDDVALMTKVAAQKTAGVLGDDLALNAEQVNGVRAERELPVVWAVAKGSLRNKLILVPLALFFSAVAPWAIMPLLMAGGVYLCFEGVEKLAHHFLHSAAEDAAHEEEILHYLEDESLDLVEFEKEKIVGAIRTDFVLSAEIIIITLGTVASANFLTRCAVLAGVGLIMTIGVYGLVALIVKLDDIGFYLQKRAALRKSSAWQLQLGFALVSFAPWLMRALTVIGTVAMFLVGGGILMHGLPALEIWNHSLGDMVSGIAVVGGVLQGLASALFDIALGILAGAFALGGVLIFNRVKSKFKQSALD